MAIDLGTVTAVRLGLGAVVFLAALAKLRHLSVFGGQLAAYRLVSRALIPYVSACVVALEFTVGTALILGIQPLWASTVAGALLVIFTGAALSALVRGLRIQCGCLGGASSDVGPGLVVRNILLLAAASFSGAAAAERSSLPQSPVTIETVIGVAGTASLLVLLTFASSSVDRLYWWSMDARRASPRVQPKGGSL